MPQLVEDDDLPTVSRPVAGSAAAAALPLGPGGPAQGIARPDAPAAAVTAARAAPLRVAPPPAPARVAPAAPSPARPAGRAAAPAGQNALIEAAYPLFSLVTQISFSGNHTDTEALQRTVLAAVMEFEAAMTAAGYRDETRVAAKYVLASMIDEAVLDTGWGFESVWGSRSLLTVLFRETWGGEKVFAILDRLKLEPSQNIDMLEMIDLCLALGFQGKYRRVEGGLFQLEDLRADLFRLCLSVRPRGDRALAPHLDTAKAGVRLRRFLPGWVGFALAGVALSAFFLVLRGNLEDEAQRTVQSLHFTSQQAAPASGAPQPALAQPGVLR